MHLLTVVIGNKDHWFTGYFYDSALQKKKE
jgi:hypothetical protein